MNQVKMRNYSPCPITEMYLAAKRCRSEGDVERFRDDPQEKQERLVRECLDAGHLAIAEAVHFTFDICGLPKSNANQLVRHRLCSYWERSGRRVVIGSQEEAWEVQRHIEKRELTLAFRKLSKYFYFVKTASSILAVAAAFWEYHDQIDTGVPVEKARLVLPQGELVDITMRTNLRNLMEMSKLRLCSKAELNMVLLFEHIRDAIRQSPDGGEFMASLLKPKCEVNHGCNEKEPCGHWNRIRQEKNE